jgi:hypothetical protein
MVDLGVLTVMKAVDVVSKCITRSSSLIVITVANLIWLAVLPLFNVSVNYTILELIDLTLTSIERINLNEKVAALNILASFVAAEPLVYSIAIGESIHTVYILWIDNAAFLRKFCTKE